MFKTVTFGEIMLRLSPPHHERLLQSPNLQATFGGAEANVAVSLAQFGVESWYVTRVPPHAVGDAVVSTLRGLGVRTGHILRGGDRLGIYFTETGASQRASTVIYDRARSAISEIEPAMVPWRAVFEAAHWFHWSGITPALGAGPAASVKAAIAAARAEGARISVDLNFRKKLWTEAEAQRTMRPLVEGTNLLVANEEDLQTVLGIDVRNTDPAAGTLDLDAYRDAAETACREYGVERVAITLRESRSATENGWQALLRDETGTFHQSQRYLVHVVDRLGAGDSFSAGMVFGILTGRSPGDALRFAVAASALKHTIPGDFNRVTLREVEELAGGDASGRVRR